MNRFEEIKKYRAEIEKLLDSNPELIPLQKEIDDAMKECGNDQQKRNEVIQEMMLNNWFRIANLEVEVKRMKNPNYDEEEYQKIMDNRVRLRCTNKTCENSAGFWTATNFKDTYLNILTCQKCDSKHAEELKAVED